MVTAMETNQGLGFRLGDALGSRWALVDPPTRSKSGTCLLLFGSPVLAAVK